MLNMPLFDRAAAWAEENLQPVGPNAIVLAGSAAYLAALAWAWQHTSYDVWGALLVAPMLIAVSIPILRRVAYDEHDPKMVRLLTAAVALKLFMALVRYGVGKGIYGGVPDAANYHNWGARLSPLFRSGDFRTLGESLSGTGFIRVLTGVIYTVTGPTIIGGFVVFAWIGFWGLYFFYRAFRLALPEADHRRYARFVFFLPSMLYWPSSIGKEAYMCFMLGISAYGAAKLLNHQRGAFAIIATGITGCAFVRPHVSLLMFIGLAMAYLVRPARRGRFGGALPKLLGMTVLIVGGIFLLDRVSSFFEIGTVSAEGTSQVFESTAVHTDEGGSAYKTVAPTSPTRFGWAVVTVLFRPFPNEAGNVQAGLASLEAGAILVLCLLSIPRVMGLFSDLRSNAYAVLAITYILLFCYAFASIGNFGILTRQRVQVLPFVLVLVCLPRRAERQAQLDLARVSD